MCTYKQQGKASKRPDDTRCIFPTLQASLRGSYTPLSDTIRQVDSVTKEDVVKVRQDY